MDTHADTPTIILLRDETGVLAPYRIDEVLSLIDIETNSVSDYTVLVKMDDDAAEPVIVRALDAEIPSFVGIEDEVELSRVRTEYDALVMRRGFRLV